jgi:hypothetical protein
MRLLPVVAALSALLAPSQPQDPKDFWNRFSAALALADSAEMKKVVAANPDGALLVFFQKVEQLAESADAELEQQVRAISLAWHDAMEEGFLENEYNFISRLGSEDRAKRLEGIGLLREGQAAVEKAGKGDEASYEEAQKKFLLAARSFDEVKDAYHAAQAYHWLAQIFDPESRPKGAEPRRAVEYYRHALERYQGIDHRGARVRSIKAREQKLVTMGYDPDRPPPAEAAPDAPGKEAPAGGPKADDPASGTSRFAPGSEWVGAELAFGVSPDEDSLELPSYDADDVLLAWNEVVVRGKVSEGQPREKLNFFDPPVYLVREKAARYSLDVNDDGTGDVPVKSLKEPTEFTHKGTSGETRHAIRLATFGNREAFQRSEMNLAPSDAFVRLGFRSVGFFSGELRGQPIRVYDLNCDGRYGAEPAQITSELIEGEPEARFDGIQIGKGSRAVPASSVVEFEGKLHRLRLEWTGGKAAARLRELAVPTGVLKLDCRGPAKPVHLVVRETGEFTGSYFDIAASPKGVLVPAGTYQIAGGLIRNGKGPSTQKIAILKGKSEEFQVAAGETKTLTMGRPYQFDFQVSKSTVAGETRYKVEGKLVTVYGAAGERYERFWDEIPLPEVTWRKAGTKSGGGKGKEMRRATPNDIDKLGFAAAWHPLDFELPAPGPGEWEFHLAERHKILGEVASDWKK